MAVTFPTSPTDGQQLTVNGKTYTYSSASGTWNITGADNPIDILFTRSEFVATADQTTFSVTYNTDYPIEVFVNGLQYLASDYTATDGTSVVFDTGLPADAEVIIMYATSSLIAIPADVSDLTDTTNIIPADISDLTDTTDVLSSGGGVTVYTTIDDLPMSGNSNGDLALVSSTNRLYLFTNSGWYSIALINQTPTITGNEASYVLAQDGTATTVTLTGTDAEGIPITWSAVTSGDTNVATVTNTDNVFTITPSTDTADQGTLTVTFRASDGVNIGTATSEFTLTFVSAFWKNASLSIGTSATDGLDNSTFIDRSTNAHTITATGLPVQTAFHPYLENWSVYFDPNSYVRSDSIGDDIGTGSFTIQLWAYTNNFSGGNIAIIGVNRLVDGFNSMILNGDTFYYNGNNTTDYSTVPLDYTWNHWVIERDATNNTVMVWLNGERVINLSSQTMIDFAGCSFAFGAEADSGNFGTLGNFLDGYIANCRIDSVVTFGDVSTINVPTNSLLETSNTVFLGLGSNRFIDISSNAHNITASVNAKISAFNPFGQESEYAAGENKGSIRFADGINEKIEWAAFGDSTTGTIEFWMYPTTWSASSGNQGVWSQGSYSPGIFLRDTGDTLDWYQSGNKTITYQPRAGEWIHVAYSIDNGSLSEYVNGTRTATASVGGFSNSINRLGSDGQSYFDGYISDFRMTYGVARYSGTTMTVPTSPVSTDADTKIYLPMDNAGIFDKTGNATLVPNSSTATSTTQTKYASSSINFPSQSTLSVVYGSWMALSDNDFTMEMWVYPTDSSGGTLWSLGYNGDNRLDFGWQASGGIRLLIETANIAKTVFASSDAVSTYLNSWVHIAVVRSGTEFTLYVNGTSTATGTSSLSIVEDTTDGWTFGGREFSPDYSGGNLNDPFTGYLENIQFFKTAKYTANFTVPDREQGRTYQAES